MHKLTLEQRNQLSLAYDSIECIDLSRFDLLLNLISRFPALFFSGRSFLAHAFTPQSIISSFRRFVGSLSVDLIHFYSIRSCPLWPLPSLFNIPYVVDLVDSMSLNFAKRVDNCHFILRPLLRLEYLRIRHFESNLPNLSL